MKEEFDKLIGKKVLLVKGDYKGREGRIIAITGYCGYGVVAKILVDGKILEYSKDFWELI